MTILSNIQDYDWATWFIGILRSFVSGGSSSMVAAMAGMGIAPDRFNLNSGASNTLKLMGIMFVFQGMYRMFEFLALHAAPDKVVSTKSTDQTVNPTSAGGLNIKTTETTTKETK